MARQKRQFMRQGVADLLTRAAVDSYVGANGEPIFDGQTLRMHDGATPGGIPLSTRIIPSAAGNPTAAQLPVGQWTVWTNSTTNVTSVWANLTGTPVDMINRPEF